MPLQPWQATAGQSADEEAIKRLALLYARAMDRNEPDIGEVNHLYLLDVLDRLGYDGYVGLEYKPRTTTGAGLGWAAKYGIKA